MKLLKLNVPKVLYFAFKIDCFVYIKNKKQRKDVNKFKTLHSLKKEFQNSDNFYMKISEVKRLFGPRSMATITS